MKLNQENGFTLLEVMIALAILASMSLVIFISSSQILQSKSDTEDRDEAYHSVTQALTRISEDLNMAILIKSKDLLGQAFDGEVYFEGTEERMDFISLSHLRYIQDAKEGELAELSYFLEAMPDEPNKKRLMRRETATVDKNLQEGGRAYPMIEGIEGIRFEYFDEKSNEFKKAWNTKSVDFGNKLPQAIKVSIDVILPNEEEKTTFTTLATIRMNQAPMAF